MLNYSRLDENEADQIGLQYLTRAGYPPSGLVGGFKIMRQKSWMTGASVPAYLSTHPDIGDRINGIQARLSSFPRKHPQPLVRQSSLQEGPDHPLGPLW